MAKAWNDMTPRERATAVTVGVVVLGMNPILPVIYAGVYGTSAALEKDNDKEDNK